MRAVALLIGATLTGSTLTGAKADIAYSVTTKSASGVLEFIIDLSQVLDEADPETGMRQPLALQDPRLTAWLPGEKAPRPSMRLWPGSQAGQYRTRLHFSGAGGASVRIDARRDEARAFAIQLPAQVGDAPAKALPARAIPPPKAEPALGDAVMGHALFNHHCACCHGKDATGPEGKAARLAEPRMQLNLNEEEWMPAILLEPIERGEVAAFLAPLRKEILPPATRYLVRNTQLSDEQKATIRRITGEATTITEVALYPLFSAPLISGPLLSGERGHAHRIADIGRELDTATRATRRGFYALIRVGELEWVLHLDNELALTKLSLQDRLGHALPDPAHDTLGARQAHEAVKLAAQAYLAEEAERATFTP